MSVKSDKFERDVAENINKIEGIEAERPAVDVTFPDVKISMDGIETWCEVKMNHRDNLSNPRMSYSYGQWATTYETPAATEAVEILNKSSLTTYFLDDISKFSGIPVDEMIISSTKSSLKEPNAVPLETMKSYFSQPGKTRYIAKQENYDMGDIVTKHYTVGKAVPAYYMQAGDDFYLISDKNPLNLYEDIPILSGKGDFKVRISTRSEFYEIQAELKIKEMPLSAYSVKPNTEKKNPFV